LIGFYTQKTWETIPSVKKHRFHQPFKKVSSGISLQPQPATQQAGIYTKRLLKDFGHVQNNCVIDLIKEHGNNPAQLKFEIKKLLKTEPQKFFDEMVDLIAIHDKYTGKEHIPGVVKNVRKMAKTFALSPEKALEIERSAMLHDVGKLFIPIKILNHKGKLFGKDLEIMQSHAKLGENFLKELGLPEINKSFKNITKFVGNHHNPFYNSFSDPVKRLQAFTLTFSDTLNALRTNRPYKKAFTWTKTIFEIMKNEKFRSSEISGILKSYFVCRIGEIRL